MGSTYLKYSILEEGLLRLNKVMTYTCQEDSETQHSQGPFLPKVIHQVRIAGETGDPAKHVEHTGTADSRSHYQCWSGFSCEAVVIELPLFLWTEP